MVAINLFQNNSPFDSKTRRDNPSLSNAVRDLANDNVITAVMLTGVMLLQVSENFQQLQSQGSLLIEGWQILR